MPGGLMDGLSGDPYAMRRMREMGENPYQNNFTQPTPEQEAKIQRDAIRETVSPLDLLMGAGVGAVMPGGMLAIPMGLANRALGGSYLGGAIGGHAIGAGMGAYAAGKGLPQVRADRIQEAEPGAFPTYGYGQRR